MAEATNWWGEHGGNRTWRGAHTQEVLMSVLRTCQQRGVASGGVIEALLRSPVSVVA